MSAPGRTRRESLGQSDKLSLISVPGRPQRESGRSGSGTVAQ